MTALLATRLQTTARLCGIAKRNPAAAILLPTGNTLALKADHGERGQDSISASYAVGVNRQRFPQGQFGLGGGSRLPAYASQSHTIVQLFATEWERALSSRLLNSARFGYSRYHETTFPGDTGFNVTAIGLNTGVNSARDSGLPEIDIAPGEYQKGSGCARPATRRRMTSATYLPSC